MVQCQETNPCEAVMKIMNWPSPHVKKQHPRQWCFSFFHHQLVGHVAGVQRIESSRGCVAGYGSKGAPKRHKFPGLRAVCATFHL